MDPRAFYLFLRWLAGETEEIRYSSVPKTSAELNLKAMGHLSADDKKSIVAFIDRELSQT